MNMQIMLTNFFKAPHVDSFFKVNNQNSTPIYETYKSQ